MVDQKSNKGMWLDHCAPLALSLGTRLRLWPTVRFKFMKTNWGWRGDEWTKQNMFSLCSSFLSSLPSLHWINQEKKVLIESTMPSYFYSGKCIVSYNKYDTLYMEQKPLTFSLVESLFWDIHQLLNIYVLNKGLLILILFSFFYGFIE